MLSGLSPYFPFFFNDKYPRISVERVKDLDSVCLIDETFKQIFKPGGGGIKLDVRFCHFATKLRAAASRIENRSASSRERVATSLINVSRVCYFIVKVAVPGETPVFNIRDTGYDSSFFSGVSPSSWPRPSRRRDLI